MYTCKAFELFVSLNKIRNIRSEVFIFEHLVIVWARLLTKWYDNEEIRTQGYYSTAVEAFFFLFSDMEREDDFPSLGNF